MVIDTSAILAILFAEPDSARMVAALEADPHRWVPAPILAEASAVLHARLGAAGGVALDALLRRIEAEVVPMSPAAAAAARSAYERYGRGVGTPPVLNFGDALAYGCARALDEPLLFKGADFAATDITPVRY